MGQSEAGRGQWKTVQGWAGIGAAREEGNKICGKDRKRRRTRRRRNRRTRRTRMKERKMKIRRR